MDRRSVNLLGSCCNRYGIIRQKGNTLPTQFLLEWWMKGKIQGVFRFDFCSSREAERFFSTPGAPVAMCMSKGGPWLYALFYLGRKIILIRIS